MNSTYYHDKGDVGSWKYCLLGLKHELGQSCKFLLISCMLSLVLFNFPLSCFTFLLTASLATNPETSFPVGFELVSTVELLLAPVVAPKIPLTWLWLIAEVVSRKSCHKMQDWWP